MCEATARRPGVLALLAASLVLATMPSAAVDGASADIRPPSCLPAPTAVPPGSSEVPCLAAAGGLSMPTRTAPCPPVPLVDDRCEEWVAIYDHEGGHGTTGIDMPFDAQMSPDGATVFVTGQSWQDTKNHYDFATLAYDAATGDRRWLARYDGPGDEHDIPQDIALSPDGSRLYVTGWVHMNPVGEGADYATVAYDAATGAQLWDATYEGPNGGDDSAYGVAVSPDGDRVYVTGKSGIQHADMDFATIAYDADTGDRLWVARHSSAPGGGEDIGISIVVAPDGETVYMTGAGGTTWTTIAYRADDDEATGARGGQELWRATFQRGYAYWIALSPSGDRIYVTGSRHRDNRGVLLPNWDYATIAYDAATGGQLWVGTWASPNVGLDVPYGHALSPAGDRIYLTGTATGSGYELNGDAVTVALDTSDGRALWASRAEMPGHSFEGGASVAAPGGAHVYTTGWSTPGFGGPGVMVTQALDVATGAPTWTARYNGLRTAQEQVFGDTVVASVGRVVATGRASYQSDPDDPLNQQPGVNSSDYVTVAYRA